MVDIIFNGNNNKKKRVKRLSASSTIHYYPSAYITKPCDQLFGPQPLDLHIDRKIKEKSINILLNTGKNITKDDLNISASSLNNTSLDISINSGNHSNLPITILDNINGAKSDLSNSNSINFNEHSRSDYIPAPKWNKVQNSILEEMFKKSRYPKPSELKLFAQRLHVMDSDIEEWFRKRRGKDRKTRRKNETLKNLIDNYLDK